MKKLLSVILIIALLSISACTIKNPEDTSSTSDAETPTVDEKLDLLPKHTPIFIP